MSMIRHIVLWSFLPSMSETEKKEAAEKMKDLLEHVASLVEGTVSLEVITEGLASSNRDVGLISLFKTEENLKTYQNHPAHLEAGKYIRTVTCDRACLDFKTED